MVRNAAGRLWWWCQPGLYTQQTHSYKYLVRREQQWQQKLLKLNYYILCINILYMQGPKVGLAPLKGNPTENENTGKSTVFLLMWQTIHQNLCFHNCKWGKSINHSNPNIFCFLVPEWQTHKKQNCLQRGWGTLSYKHKYSNKRLLLNAFTDWRNLRSELLKSHMTHTCQWSASR